MTPETREKIKALRKRIAANKGIAGRAEVTAGFLRVKASKAHRQIWEDQQAILALGGKVKL